MRLDERALLSQWEEKQRRAAHAPHGLKRKRERERRALNGKAAKPWPAEIRKVLAAGPASDALPDGRARFPQVMRRRCDCGRLFETDVVDQTMCATCTENAARHRQAQAREARP